MDKFGAIMPGYTPPRDAQEKTTEQLDNCLEKKAADVAEQRCSKESKEAKEAK